MTSLTRSSPMPAAAPGRCLLLSHLDPHPMDLLDGLMLVRWSARRRAPAWQCKPLARARRAARPPPSHSASSFFLSFRNHNPPPSISSLTPPDARLHPRPTQGLRSAPGPHRAQRRRRRVAAPLAPHFARMSVTASTGLHRAQRRRRPPTLPRRALCRPERHRRRRRCAPSPSPTPPPPSPLDVSPRAVRCHPPDAPRRQSTGSALPPCPNPVAAAARPHSAPTGSACFIVNPIWSQ